MQFWWATSKCITQLSITTLSKKVGNYFPNRNNGMKIILCVTWLPNNYLLVNKLHFISCWLKGVVKQSLQNSDEVECRKNLASFWKATGNANDVVNLCLLCDGLDWHCIFASQKKIDLIRPRLVQRRIGSMRVALNIEFMSKTEQLVLHLSFQTNWW